MQDDKTEPARAQKPAAVRDSAAAAALHVDGSSNDAVVTPAADGGRAPRNARSQRVGIAVVAVLSALLIGVSAFSLAGGEPAGEHGAADDAAVVAEPSVDEAVEEQSAASDEAAADGASAVDGDSPDSASEAASPATQAPAQSAAATGAEQTSAPQAATPQSQPSANEQPAARMVNVTVTVDSSVVGNPVSGSGTFSLPQGSTAYDALCQLTTPNGGPNYVRAIGGLAEFDHGAQSGWKYSVNGVDPSMACGSYVLSDGDVVAWRYVTSLNG